MTKKRKIELLVKEVNKLSEENKQYKKLSNENLSRDMLKEIKRYSDIMERLHKSNQKLDEMRFMGLMNRWKYKWMMCGVKMKRMLRI